MTLQSSALGTNFYASPEYLGSVAEAYFAGRRTSVEEVRIDDDVLRLLVVDDAHVVTNAMFLDYHQPVASVPVREQRRKHVHAKGVVRRVIEHAEWKREPAAFADYEIAPYVDWSTFPSFADYETRVLDPRGSLLRERERRAQRLVDKFGEISFTVADTRADVLPFVQLHEGRRLRARGLTNYFSDSKTHAYLAALRRSGALTMTTLRSSERILSAWIGFIHDRVWSGWIWTHDPEFEKYSVGHQLLHCMLRESHRRGHREFDFSSGAAPYKTAYATHDRLLGSIGRPPLSDRMFAGARSAVRSKLPRIHAAACSVTRALANRGHEGTDHDHAE